MQAQLITIGDELLYGVTVDTNASFMAQRLGDIGVQVVCILTVGDRIEQIAEALQTAMGKVDVVIATGGLGPTPDDVTREAMARALKRELVFDERLFSEIEQRWIRRGKPVPSSAKILSLIPRGVEIVTNAVGAAAGLKVSQGGTLFFFLPGVPEEMRCMIDDCVLPSLKKRAKGAVLRHLTLRTAGINESSLAERLTDIEEICPGITIAYLPQTTEVHLRLTTHGDSVEKAECTISKAEGVVRERLGYYIYSSTDQSLEEVVADLLFTRALTLAVAESCSGGLICGRLTDVPGSSGFLKLAIVAYSRQAKETTLGIPAEILDRHGIVSPETAKAMAEHVRSLAGSDLGLSVTGIMGPTGGTPEQPVGLAYVGLAHGDGSYHREFRFLGDRIVNKQLTAQAALNELRLFLLQFSQKQK
jgi:nicotinamide-nucleotide amidase